MPTRSPGQRNAQRLRLDVAPQPALEKLRSCTVFDFWNLTTNVDLDDFVLDPGAPALARRRADSVV